MEKIDQLRAALPNLDQGSRSFAENLIAGYERYGSWTAKQIPWVHKIIDRAEAKAIGAGRRVGEMGGILALFDRAKKHLKFPAIVLGIPALGPEVAVRINVAGERAKQPGTLTVVDAARDEDGERAWLGRVMLDGFWKPSNAAIDALSVPAIAARLAEFAANPAKVAGEHGRLTGRCCFCRMALTDERSTAVGYGKTCAKHFGLPWGDRPAEFAAAAAGPGVKTGRQWLMERGLPIVEGDAMNDRPA